MADVISFQDVVRSRRRQKSQELMQRCTRIVELNLHLAVDLYDVAPEAEKPVRARHIRRLGELLEYLVSKG